MLVDRPRCEGISPRRAKLSRRAIGARALKQRVGTYSNLGSNCARLTGPANIPRLGLFSKQSSQIGGTR